MMRLLPDVSAAQTGLSAPTSIAHPCTPYCPFQEGLQELTSRIWSNDLEIYHPIIQGPPSSRTDLQMTTKTHDRLVVPIHRPIYCGTGKLFLGLMGLIQCRVRWKHRGSENSATGASPLREPGWWGYYVFLLRHLGMCQVHRFQLWERDFQWLAYVN